MEIKTGGRKEAANANEETRGKAKGWGGKELDELTFNEAMMRPVCFVSKIIMNAVVYVSHSHLGKTAVNRVRVSGSVPHSPSLYGVIRWVLEFNVRAEWAGIFSAELLCSVCCCAPSWLATIGTLRYPTRGSKENVGLTEKAWSEDAATWWAGCVECSPDERG